MTPNTPPTGRNSWSADEVAREKLLDCGYEYLVIDNRRRSKTKDTDDNFVPDPEKKRHGMKNAADKWRFCGDIFDTRGSNPASNS